MGTIARYISHDLERVEVIPLLAWRLLFNGSLYGPSSSKPERRPAAPVPEFMRRQPHVEREAA